MRSTSPFVKLTAIAFVAAFLAFGLSAGTAHAGLAQATATADVAAAAGTSSASAFVPCPAAVVATADAGTQAAIAGTPEVAATDSALALTPAATVNANPGFLGVRAEQVDSCGVRIVEVVANSPAAQAQLQADDVVVALNGVPTPEISGLRLSVEAHVPGDKITLTVQRSGAQLDVTVTLGVKPADTTATMPAAPEAAATDAATAASGDAAATTQATQ